MQTQPISQGIEFGIFQAIQNVLEFRSWSLQLFHFYPTMSTFVTCIPTCSLDLYSVEDNLSKKLKCLGTAKMLWSSYLEVYSRYNCITKCCMLMTYIPTYSVGLYSVEYNLFEAPGMIQDHQDILQFRSQGLQALLHNIWAYVINIRSFFIWQSMIFSKSALFQMFIEILD